jgi:hypothetical protein
LSANSKSLPFFLVPRALFYQQQSIASDSDIIESMFSYLQTVSFFCFLLRILVGFGRFWSQNLSRPCQSCDINSTANPPSSSIGGLVVKLAVAIRDHQISYDSASPGFDSRPMHHTQLLRAYPFANMGPALREDRQTFSRRAIESNGDRKKLKKPGMIAQITFAFSPIVTRIFRQGLSCFLEPCALRSMILSPFC